MKFVGRQIFSFEQLLKQEKSVYIKPWKKFSAMAFILGLPLRLVNNYLKAGWIFETKDGVK